MLPVTTVGAGISALAESVAQRVRLLDALLRTDGGGLELVSVSAMGSVRIRFRGLCCQCPLKPVTVVTTVRPELLSLDGVSRVQIDGGRISSEAEERLARYLHDCPAGAGRGTP